MNCFKLIALYIPILVSLRVNSFEIVKQDVLLDKKHHVFEVAGAVNKDLKTIAYMGSDKNAKPYGPYKLTSKKTKFKCLYSRKIQNSNWNTIEYKNTKRKFDFTMENFS